MTTRYKAMEAALRRFIEDASDYGSYDSALEALAMPEDVKPEPIRFTNRQIYEAVLAAMKECAADEPPQSFEEFMINTGQSVVFLREFIRAISEVKS